MAAISLQQLNTFGLDAYASELIAITSVAQLEALLPFSTPFLVLGGGSNMLFSEDYDGTILANKIRGIEHWEDDEHHYFRVAGGENWHDFVMHCVALNIGGLENLALIPGSVGAAPVQNIGAYGVELSQVCHEVIAYDVTTGQRCAMNSAACQFAYRESYFKQQRQCFIAQVTFKLAKQWQPQLGYGELKTWSNGLGYTATPLEVAQEVIKVRHHKLPDPASCPNVGSFFKNPVVTNDQAGRLKKKYQDMPQYSMDDGVKLAAGWLIDHLGFKGESVGGAAVHKQQALVLVNEKEATSVDVMNLANKIIQSVEATFNVTLEPEVNFIDRVGYSTLDLCHTKGNDV
jgi:UDP-N-acetylmuramate dehydrogenase